MNAQIENPALAEFIAALEAGFHIGTVPDPDGPCGLMEPYQPIEKKSLPPQKNP